MTNSKHIKDLYPEVEKRFATRPPQPARRHPSFQELRMDGEKQRVEPQKLSAWEIFEVIMGGIVLVALGIPVAIILWYVGRVLWWIFHAVVWEGFGVGGVIFLFLALAAVVYLVRCVLVLLSDLFGGRI